MEKIILEEIKKHKNRIEYVYRVTQGLQMFFSGTAFVIDYPENVEPVPDAVAAVPFVCNVLPIVWLTDSTLILRELDEDFYQCLPNLKKGYETMFPESEFRGEIEVSEIVSSPSGINGNSALFYSGGLDSAQTLISHLQELPALISIWGSDIKYDNEAGWSVAHAAIAEAAERYSLPDVVIHSTFRLFDREYELDRTYHEQLRDGWWHGVKHGIGLLGHVAPYAWLHGLSNMYIASSNCPRDGEVRCASNPLTDNQVRFSGCKVRHDGFEFSRQDKLRNLVQYCKETGDPVTLHVCWQSQGGGNCCSCEKCYRTIAGLIAEGADPVQYGFPNVQTALKKMRIHVVEWETNRGLIRRQWTYIHDRAVENREKVKKMQYWPDFCWIEKTDFSRPEKLRMPFFFRLKRKLRKYLRMQNQKGIQTEK